MLGQIHMKSRIVGRRHAVKVPTAVVISCLEPAYRSALRLKVDMLLTSKQYTAQFVAPGRERDDREMDIEPFEDGQMGERVIICLFPQIRSAPFPDEDPVIRKDGMGSPQIKYQNLSLAKTEDEVDGELLYKPLVWA
ncbi:hypothetical protein PG991_006065 [Apiospora marii]|uniref:Uncharacterized protein n=1 Tax=Apiospora marii TaxID=335849 RepID=A0ABR1SCT4_9PEZI